MRPAGRFLFASIAALAVSWAAGLASTTWGSRSEDLGLGIIVVSAFAAGHVLALGLALTSLVSAAIGLRRSVGRTKPAFLTLGASAVLTVFIAVYLRMFLGVRA